MRWPVFAFAIMTLNGCVVPEGTGEAVELTADIAGTAWPPAKWIILGLFGVATATGVVKINKKEG